MAFLNSILAFFGSATAIAPSITAPGKMWHLVILKVFSFVADYGWRIVVFTVLLKLLLSPLDFYQRYKMNKNQKITERLKPTMEKLQKQYGGDKQAFSQKQMELNRREGYSYFSSCLPMIATLVIFITLWLSMNTVAQFMTLKQYAELYDEYNVAYSQAVTETDDAKAVEIGQDVVFTMYYDGITDEYVAGLREKYGLSESFDLENSDKIQASFLWVKNIWAPDVPWGNKAILSYDSFIKAIDKYKNSDRNGLDSDKISDLINSQGTYERVMARLLSDDSHSKTNGFLILPILVVVLSVGSQLLTMMQQKRAGQVNAKGGTATSMKVMMFIMPVMMAVFAIQYASIFTLYMVMNSAMSLTLNALFSFIIKAMDKRKRTRNYGISTGSARTVTYKKSPIIHYVKGANPNAGAREVEPVAPEVAETADAKKPKVKKQKTKKQPNSMTVVRSGRPDPNELLNMENRTNKKK